ncbi:MAG TPA: branched-chain amino acid aminotransferase [Geminicoccus sp.]|uniref:branched-chain amino acid aminotransferase n=1 Tax=Geminicoccus sp. TaxID=2024832 RepID=UPI002CFE040B|nr:branched-chain amino acid aminotransferase [Geminicoccus sp.]HWL69028.1 branched-chain amino acid aminotransferase [Geminicoccus sp.]
MAALIPYHDRDGWIWYDGEMVPWRDARLHVLTHGLHYGSSVFEGERAYGGKVFKLREHSQRLIDSGRVLGFEIPWTVEQIDEATNATIAKNGLSDCYVRPIAWRGSEMMGVAAQASKIHLAIAVWEWGAYYSDLRLTRAVYDRPAPNTAPVHAKAAGLYMICTICKHAAEAKGFGDALMLDYRGYVAETTGANIFLVMGGKLHTPIADCFLNGITRRTVIGLAKARGIEVIERHIKPEELANAQEIFVTGTAAEITPVRAIDELTYEVGPLTRQLLEDFHAATRGHAKAAA